MWLRGFDKLKQVNPGETRSATFLLRRKDLSLWSTEKQLWYIPEGEIQLQVGASSTKLYLVWVLLIPCCTSFLTWLRVSTDYFVVAMNRLHDKGGDSADRRITCDLHLRTSV